VKHNAATIRHFLYNRPPRILRGFLGEHYPDIIDPTGCELRVIDFEKSSVVETRHDLKSEKTALTKRLKGSMGESLRENESIIAKIGSK